MLKKSMGNFQKGILEELSVGVLTKPLEKFQKILLEKLLKKSVKEFFETALKEIFVNFLEESQMEFLSFILKNISQWIRGVLFGITLEGVPVGISWGILGWISEISSWRNIGLFFNLKTAGMISSEICGEIS